MKITVTTLVTDKCFLLDVSEELNLHNFKAFCEVESGIAKNEMLVYHNGKPLLNDLAALSDCGVGDGDCLTIAGYIDVPQHYQQQQQPQQQLSSNSLFNNSENFFDIPVTEIDPNTLREMILANPAALDLVRRNNVPLARALDSGNAELFKRVFAEQLHAQQEQSSMEGVPYNPDAQCSIEELIRQENVQTNMETAMEYNPEIFCTVSLLFVNCKLNDVPIKALVDTGAQSSVISRSCAKRCHIDRLLDTRFEGLAFGVGAQRIIGRIHMVEVQIGSEYLKTSLTVLDEHSMDLILGLDMLKKHKCQIDIKNNVLRIGSTGIETEFLPESETNEATEMALTATINNAI